METYLIVGVLSPSSEARKLSSSARLFPRGRAKFVIFSMERDLLLEKPPEVIHRSGFREKTHRPGLT